MPKKKARVENGKGSGKEQKKQKQFHCVKCNGTGMVIKDHKLFQKKERCDNCNTWEEKVKALIPK